MRRNFHIGRGKRRERQRDREMGRGRQGENNSQVSFFMCSVQSSSSCTVHSVSSQTERKGSWSKSMGHTTQFCCLPFSLNILCVFRGLYLMCVSSIYSFANTSPQVPPRGWARSWELKRCKKNKLAGSFSLSLDGRHGYRHTHANQNRDQK